MAKKTPRRLKNKAIRPHEYLERDKVERMMRAAEKAGRHGHRDRTMILIAWRHGLRAMEITRMLDWHQVDFEAKTISILRCKGSKDSEHTMAKDEVAALKKLGPQMTGPIFVNERGAHLSERGFHAIVQRAGEQAGLGPNCHPHMLRHGCGYDMVERDIPLRLVQDWLGHRAIQTTVLYTELGPGRFKRQRGGMW